MKNIQYILVFAIASTVIISGCKKPYDYDKEIGAPKYSAEKLAAAINGKWTLNEAIQVDELSITKESVDITDFYIADGAMAPNITFNAGASTFTVDTAGLLFNYFLVAQGKWGFDDERYPTKINLTDDSGNALGSIAVGSNLLGFTPKLNFESSAACSGSAVMSYNLLFTKSN